MSGILFPDIGGALSAGASAAQAGVQNQFLQDDRKAKAEIAPLIPKALQGDKDALGTIATRHPDTAMKLAPLLERLDAGQRAKAKDDVEYTIKTGLGLLNAPPEQQAGLYAQARAQRAAQGGNVSNWPAQYDPAWVQFQVNQGMTVKDHLDRQNEGPQAMPSPGGGAAPMPAGPGGSVIDRSRAASAGLESGGRYDAIGPVVNSKGNRAYGAHQVMDFNIGPWTQEVLGQAMTPQQFLANPKAQDAVYNAKMGQYIQKYGSPEAGARAWFAGEGGMNNPGAKDVLGTTVQAYGDRFAQAYGAGATGPGPQIAQGDNTRADANGNALPPPATAPGAPDGTDINGLRKQLIATGGDLFTDPKTKQIEMQNGHYVVRSTQNPRQIIRLIPAPKAKEEGTGPFKGTGAEVQGLNILVQNGTLTLQQAAEVAAGKTVIDPETKQTIFLTPSGIFGQKPGQAPQPLASPAPGMAAPQGVAPMAPAGGAQTGVPMPASSAPANPGAIPLTGTKATGQPSATEMASLRSARVEFDKINAAAEDFKSEWNKATPVERARTLSGAPTPLASSYYNFALLAKGDVLYKLGVLNGPDLTIIQKALADPSTWKSVFASDNDVIGAVDKALNIVKTGISSTERQFGIAPPSTTAKPPQGQSGGTYMHPSNVPVSWAEIQDTAKKRGISPEEVITTLGLKPTGMQ